LEEQREAVKRQESRRYRWILLLTIAATATGIIAAFAAWIGAWSDIKALFRSAPTFSASLVLRQPSRPITPVCFARPRGFSAAVATSRECHRMLLSGPGGQLRRCGRAISALLWVCGRGGLHRLSQKSLPLVAVGCAVLSTRRRNSGKAS